MPSLEAGGKLGRYRLESLLGEGAMGLVYRAVREDDGETVALKILRPELDRDDVYLRRFSREARIAGGLSHENLVPVLDAGEAEGVHYLAARYVEGGTLAERLRVNGPLSVDGTLRVAAQVGSALAALHRHGLVHRDVKPANVILDRDGNAALTDFGLARSTAESVLTSSGHTAGTLDYTAPEVITEGVATSAGDIYGLGCVVFECLAGRPPFGDLPVHEVARAHVEREPPDPCAGRDDAPGDLAWAVRLALAKDPSDRPRTAIAYVRVLAASASARPG